MLNTTIKLTDETKGLLDDIQAKFGLKTYDTTVKTCAVFIIRNEINLREDYIGDYKKGLIDLENRILAKFQSHEDKILSNNSSLRKWVGGVEKDYFKPLLQKLDTLDKLGDFGFDRIVEEKLNSPKVENPLNSHIKSEEKEISKVEEPRGDISNKDEKFKEIYGKYEAQKQALFKIFNNSKVETGGMLSKERIIVNLSSEEWEELKNLS